MGEATTVTVRAARASDVEGIRDVFVSAYGLVYPHQRFLDREWLTSAVYNNDALVLVAVEYETDRVVGTASVVFDVAAHSDLIGEFGRLVVRPDCRGRGIGGKLMNARLAFMEGRLQVGIVANRVIHMYSQRISRKYGFAHVGLMPMRHRFDEREHIALYVKYFGNALELRRNHPRVIPECLALAQAALSECGLPTDAVADESSAPYPHAERFELEEFSDVLMPSLLRIERGRLSRREIFGPMRLHYGTHALSRRSASYLIARDITSDPSAPVIAGAIGYLRHEEDRAVQIFELIAHSDRVPRFLFERLVEQFEDDDGVEYVEVDVSAYAPRMQRTLLELGFLPAGYVPAMVFHEVERLDIVKMSRLFVPARVHDIASAEESLTISAIVRRTFERNQTVPKLAAVVDRLRAFHGLNEEQVQRIACSCRVVEFEAGECVFRAGDDANEMFIVIDGDIEVTVQSGETETSVGHVGSDDSLGEVACLLREPHSATARTTVPTTVARLSDEQLTKIARSRPDIAVVLYRNLAEGLGRKLRRVDRRLGARPSRQG